MSHPVPDHRPTLRVCTLPSQTRKNQKCGHCAEGQAAQNHIRTKACLPTAETSVPVVLACLSRLQSSKAALEVLYESPDGSEFANAVAQAALQN